MQKLILATLLLLAWSVQARQLASRGSEDQTGGSTLQVNGADVTQAGFGNLAEVDQSNLNAAFTKRNDQTDDSGSSRRSGSDSGNVDGGRTTQINQLDLDQFGKFNKADVSQSNVNINKNKGEGQEEETPAAGYRNGNKGPGDNNRGGQDGKGDWSKDNGDWSKDNGDWSKGKGDWSKDNGKPGKPEEKPTPKPTVIITPAKPAPAKPAPVVKIVKKPAPPTVIVVKPCPEPVPVCSDEVAAACCESYELTCDAQYKPIHPQTCTVKKLVGAVVKDCDYTLDKSDYNPLVWTFETETCVCPQPVKKVVVAVQASADAYASSSGGK